MVLVIGGAFQGKKRFAKENLGFSEENIFCDLHERIREYDNDGEALAADVLESGCECVISDEIGCGVVPINDSEIRRREALGRALCLLSAKSTEVWRVVMGIGVRVK